MEESSTSEMVYNNKTDTQNSMDLIFNAMPVDQFIVMIVLAAIFLLGIPLNLLSITSIIARSAYKQVDVLDTYVLNACLAYVWMLLFSLIPYMIRYLAPTEHVFGRIGCLFVPFLRKYPVYVQATLVTAMAVHGCRGADGKRRGSGEWTTRLAVSVAWISGLMAILEVSHLIYSNM